MPLCDGRLPVVMLSVMVLHIWLGVSGQDTLALLSGTLRTFQVASCDGEILRLSCPTSTGISITLVQYGRQRNSQHVCPQLHQTANNTRHCTDRNALKVVVSACAGRSSCQMETSPDVFGVDPCPGLTKYVEVLYKCRPSEFRSEVVCQGQRRNITCSPHTVAIYSASFGVSKSESLLCRQPAGAPPTSCHASFTAEKMINKCQGRSSCELDADAALFNRPCPMQYNPYLKTTYTCVPQEILREKYRQFEEDYFRDVTPNNTVPARSNAPSATSPTARDNRPVTLHTYDRGALMVYVGVSVGCAVLICLLVALARFLCNRDGQVQCKPLPTPAASPVHGFGDSVCDLAIGDITPSFSSHLNSDSRLRPEYPRFCPDPNRSPDAKPRSLTSQRCNGMYYS